MTPKLPPGEILFEFRRLGDLVKVSAVHVDSNTEISLAGPAAVGEHSLKFAAMRKLAYVMAKTGA
jgi:hypothetical protein